MRNRRSRNRLARSQEVSEAITQQWQAAPCRKSSGSCGVRLAQIGSDEQRVARLSARRRPLEPGWLDQLDQPAEGAVAVGRGRDDQQPRRRRRAVRPPATRTVARSGWRRSSRRTSPSRGSARGEGVDQPVPGRLQPRVRVNVLGGLGEPPVEVAPVRAAGAFPQLASQRPALPRRPPGPRRAGGRCPRRGPRWRRSTPGSGSRVSGTSRPARSSTRSSASIRVNPTSALTLRSLSTARTRVISGRSSLAALPLGQGQPADRHPPLLGVRIRLEVAPFGCEQVDRVPVLEATPPARPRRRRRQRLGDQRRSARRRTASRRR